MADGDPRVTPHCLVCNTTLCVDGSDSRNIYQHGILADRLQPILQVSLFEGSSQLSQNICLNCELQVGLIEEYYKVLDKFRKNFAHTASFYGLELVPISEEQKVTPYGYINHSQGQLPTYSQAQIQPHMTSQQTVQVQQTHQANQGPWEEILFCIEPQSAQGTTQVLQAVQSTINTSVAGLVEQQHPQQQPIHHPQEQPQHHHQQQQQLVQQHAQQQQQLQHTEQQHNHPTDLQQQQQHEAQQHHSQKQDDVSDETITIEVHPDLHKKLTDTIELVRVGMRFQKLDNPQRRPTVYKSTNDQRQHLCKVCSKGFLNGTHLKQHMRTHTGEKPYKCPECTAAFSMQCNLKRHLLLHTGERPYTCVTCDRRYKQLAHLKRHMRTHDGSKPFKCLQCEKSFRFEHDYKEHMRIHNGQGPFICPFCCSTFLRQRSYREHLKVHSDDRPHRCDICSSSYKRRSELVIHKRGHTGERPFACDICTKSFVTSSKLAIHKALHTDVRPYKCEICSATFKQKNNLKAHEKRHKNRSLSDNSQYLNKVKNEDDKKLKKKKKKKKKRLDVGETCVDIQGNSTGQQECLTGAEIDGKQTEIKNIYKCRSGKDVLLENDKPDQERCATQDESFIQKRQIYRQNPHEDKMDPRIDFETAIECKEEKIEQILQARISSLPDVNLSLGKNLCNEEFVFHQPQGPKVVTVQSFPHVDRLEELAAASVHVQNTALTGIISQVDKITGAPKNDISQTFSHKASELTVNSTMSGTGTNESNVQSRILS